MWQVSSVQQRVGGVIYPLSLPAPPGAPVLTAAHEFGSPPSARASPALPGARSEQLAETPSHLRQRTPEDVCYNTLNVISTQCRSDASHGFHLCMTPPSLAIPLHGTMPAPPGVFVVRAAHAVASPSTVRASPAVFPARSEQFAETPPRPRQHTPEDVYYDIVNVCHNIRSDIPAQPCSVPIPGFDLLMTPPSMAIRFVGKMHSSVCHQCQVLAVFCRAPEQHYRQCWFPYERPRGRRLEFAGLPR